MGAVLDSSKRGIDPHKVKVFTSMRRLRTGKEVQKVLGYLNFLRDFIPLYANIVGLMEGLRSAKVILNDLWKESGGEGAFELAKKVLSEAPILHNLDWSLEFFLETDASQYGVGAILYQETEEGKRYVDFAAKAFNKAQQNYNATKRELLAGLYAMNHWRPWLLFRKFTWGLDSKAVSFINTLTNRVVLDWINIFTDFDFETRFKRGILNVLPHQLSHMYDMLQLDFGRGENLGDVEMGLLERGVKQVGSMVAVARGVGSGFDQSTKKFIQEKLSKEAPPVEERLKLVADTHKQSHMGSKMLFKMLWEDGFFWDSMWSDCEKEVAKCCPCQVFNVGRCGFQLMEDWRRTFVQALPERVSSQLLMVCRSEERLLSDPNWGDIVYLADVAWCGMKQEEGERKNMSGASRGGLSAPKMKSLKQPAQQCALCQSRAHDQSLCVLNLKGRNFKEGLRCQLCGLDGHAASMCNEYIQRVAEKKNKSFLPQYIIRLAEVLYDTGASRSHCDEKWAVDHGFKWKKKEGLAATKSGLEVKVKGEAWVKFTYGAAGGGEFVKRQGGDFE